MVEDKGIPELLSFQRGDSASCPGPSLRLCTLGGEVATGSLGCFRLQGRLDGSLRFLTAPATTDYYITCHPGPFGALLSMTLRPSMPA